MTVLKRVEELYLDVLRFILIAAASILLIAAVGFGVMAGKNYSQSSQIDKPVPAEVNPSEVTDSVLASKSENKPSSVTTPSRVGEDGKTADPNEQTYERIAKIIVEFVRKNGQGLETIQLAPVIEVTRRKAHQYDDPTVVKEFADGLVITMEKTLADPKIAKLFEPAAPAPVAPSAPVANEGEVAEQQAAPVTATLRESPIEIVNSTLTTYIRLFNAKIKEREQAKAAAIAEEVQSKATAMTQLTIAGSTFGAFLFLVFISIVVKIERNLRVMPVAQRVATEQPISAQNS